MTEETRPAMKDGIIKRGSTYSYVVRERDPKTGRTRPRWVGGFPTQKAAKAARDKARVNVSRGTYVAPTNLTVSDWLDQWLTGHTVELKPSTVHAYRQKIDSYLKPTIGAERLQSLSPSRLSVVFRTMSESGGAGGRPLSARSVEYTRAILRKALNDAVTERVIEINPVTGSKIPKRDGKPKHVTWTGAQQRSFLAAVDATRWSVVWLVALATGMRRGELCGLTWADVDLKAGVIAVERSTTQLGGRRVTTTPKNHERRKVSIDPTTTAALKEWRRKQAEERLAWGAAYQDVDGLVFTWEDGTPVPPDYLTKEFVKVQSSLGLPRMSLHGTRHSHATTLLREGVPVHIVSKRLGHKDPSVTLNVYADAIPEDDDRAVAVFSRAVWGA
jgi:integrase